MSSTTLIIGATTNPERTAFQAAGLLKQKGIQFIAVGIKEGTVFGEPILAREKLAPDAKIDTVTLYVRPEIQKEWYDQIVALKPRRIIFNPGTENPEFEKIASAAGIESINACTLVMLTTGQY